MPETREERRSLPRTGARQITPSGPMVLIPADTLQQAADLICGRVEELQQAEARGYRRGWAACEAAVRQLADAEPEPLDFDEPGPWPIRQLEPLPRIDPELDRRRYPPHGRKRFGEPRPGDFPGRLHPDDYLGGPA